MANGERWLIPLVLSTQCDFLILRYSFICRQQSIITSELFSPANLILKRHSAFPTMSALWLHDFLRDTKWRGAPRETRTTNSALTTYAICRHAERAATHSTLQQLCKKAAARSFSPSLLLSATLASLISAQWDQSRCMQSGLLQRVTRK